MTSNEYLDELLEKIEDHDSEFWETEKCDLDGATIKVVNVSNASRMLKQYGDMIISEKEER